MESNTIELSLLNGFKLKVNGETLVSSKTKLSKIWETLVILTMTRDKPISNTILTSYLWTNDTTVSTQNALKNVIYCLRRDICTKNDIDANVILFSQGIYRINPYINIKSDVVDLENTFKSLMSENIDTETRIKMCKKILSNYGDGFVLNVADYPYAQEWSTHLKNIYLSTCRYLCNIYFNDDNFIETIEICRFAIAVDSCNETMLTYLFKSLKKLERFTSIIEEYHQSNKIFSVELDKELPTEIKNIFDDACSNIDPDEQDIVLILAELRANINNATGSKKAYFCNYDVFMNMCDMKTRDASRLNKKIALMLISLESNDDYLEEESLVTTMEILQKIIGSSLRKGDVFAKYKKSKFVLMMLTDSIEQLDRVVVERIENKFAIAIKHKNSIINHYHCKFKVF